MSMTNEHAAPNKNLNPTKMDAPAFLLSAPFSYSTKEPNNIWMLEYSDADRIIDMDRAVKQFMELYSYMASMAYVQILPPPRNCTLQDLVFVTNLGIVLDHLPDKNTIVMANFTSPPRMGETDVGVKFFDLMGYDVHVPPYKFEGEAELKYLHDNVYIGGYGIRSDRRVYDWMEEQFDMRVIKVKMDDEYLYHLDCTIFPITRQKTFVCTEMYEPDELRAIEHATEIIDVSYDHACSGITNSVRLYNVILNASNLDELTAGTQLYQEEASKNRRLEEIAVELGFEVCYFNLSEYMKGGGLLSCLVMHLNHKSHELDLV